MARQREEGHALSTETSDKTDTLGRILDAAEALLQRHGPAKLTVVDVARHLGMSHANVYRYVPSKEALRDRVVERWLHNVLAPLGRIAAEDSPAPLRLRAWLDALSAAKRRKVGEDPGLFETYHAEAMQSRAVIARHLAEMRGQLAAILADGMAAGTFAPGDPAEAAAAVLDATVRFHHPYFLHDPALRPTEAEQARAYDLVLRGLAP